MNNQLKLRTSTIEAVQINNLAYELEKANPHLNFFEVNKMVADIINNRKLVLIHGGKTE